MATTILGSYEREPRRDKGQTERTAILKSLSEDKMRATIILFGEEFEVPVHPGMYAEGGLVSVLESKGKPVRVLAALSDRPVGLADDAPAPAPVTALPSLLPSTELSEEERARLDQVAADIEQAQTEFEAAQVELGSRLTAAEQADAQAREDIQALDTRLETAKVDLSGIRAELADAVAVAEDAGARAAALEAEADRLASELGVTDAKAVAAREAADAAQAEADRLASDLGVTDAKAVAAREAADAAQAEADRLASELGVTDAKAVAAREAADAAQAEAERLAGLLADAVEAAQAAQATADQATIDARDAHNAAVETQAELDRVMEASRKNSTNLLAQVPYTSGWSNWGTEWTVGEDYATLTTGSQRNPYTRNMLPVFEFGRTYEFSIEVAAGAMDAVVLIQMYGYVDGVASSNRRVDGPAETIPAGTKRRVRFRYTPQRSTENGWRPAFRAVGFNVTGFTVKSPVLTDVSDVVAAEQAAAKAQQDAQLALDAIATLEGGEFATTVLESINGKNSITLESFAPSDTANPGVSVGDLWWVTSESFVVAQYTWDGARWVPSLVSNEMLAGLDVHKLQVTDDARIAEAVIEKLWVDGLVAKVLTTSRLVVAPGNHYRDPNLIDPAGWGTYWNATQGYTGGGSILLPASTRNRFQYDLPDSDAMQGTRVEGGREYVLSIWVNADSAVNNNAIRIYVRWFTADRIRISIPSVPLPGQAGGVWTRHEVTFTAPATAAFMTLGLQVTSEYTGAARFSDISLVPKVGAVLIEDGAVTADKLAAWAVTAEKLAAGSVTARTLAVVPETGQGGLLLDAQGFTIRSADGDRFISLRADTEQTISFVEGDEITFSVTPEGELVSRSVAANESFTYQGTELSELLAAFPRGVITQTQMSSTAFSTGTATARFIHATFTPPSDSRMIRVTVEVNVGGESASYIQLKQAAGSTVTWRNATVATTYLDAQPKGTETRFISWVKPSGASGWRWPTDGTEITLAGFIRSFTDTKVVVNGNYGVYLTIEDIGPAVEVETVDPWVPAQTTGETETGTEAVVSKKTQKRVFTPTWGRSYINTSSVYNWKPDQVFHGGSPAGGALSSLVGFSYSDIVAFCSGADMVSARVYVKNSHTWSTSGATITVGAHGRQSAPASFTGMTTLGSPRFKRGEGRWIGLNNMLATLKSGGMTGVGFNNGSSSTADYAYFDWRATRLEITVRK